MKFMLFSVFVTFFVALPMYVLNTLVLPELQTIQQVYSNADAIAQRAAGVPATVAGVSP